MSEVMPEFNFHGLTIKVMSFLDEEFASHYVVLIKSPGGEWATLSMKETEELSELLSFSDEGGNYGKTV